MSVAEMSPTRTQLAHVQAPIEAVARQVRAVDIRRYEVLPADKLFQEFIPAALKLVKEALHVVKEVIAACESTPEGVRHAVAAASAAAGRSGGKFEEAIDAAVQQSSGKLGAVEDIAFMVQMELSQRAERLAQMDATSAHSLLLTECDSALRRVNKGMGAIDHAIAEAQSVPPRLDYSSEIQTSLVVRSAYAKFRSSILAAETPATDKIFASLRAVGTQIAMLVGWEAYPMLRVYDRLMIRDLQQRILNWLRSGNRDDYVTGAILWQELLVFARMTAQVNQRQEVMQYDRKMVGEIYTRLKALTKPPVDKKTAEMMRTLEGLDDDFDALLAKDDLWDLAAWTKGVKRIAARLGVDLEAQHG